MEHPPAQPGEKYSSTASQSIHIKGDGEGEGKIAKEGERRVIIGELESVKKYIRRAKLFLSSNAFSLFKLSILSPSCSSLNVLFLPLSKSSVLLSLPFTVSVRGILAPWRVVPAISPPRPSPSTFCPYPPPSRRLPRCSVWPPPPRPALPPLGAPAQTACALALSGETRGACL